jgi:transketolase
MSDRLTQKASQIRQSIVKMLLEAGSGHSAGALGMTDVFTALYFDILKHNPHKPHWSERDYVILSNGHICPVLYATLAESGYFDRSELATLRKIDSRLQGHPQYRSLPGVENTSGPIGQGLSQAAGLAVALKMDRLKNRVYAVLSDAEHQEGQTWEAYQFAGARRLDNLTALIDRNNIQISGSTEDIMPLQPLKQKLEDFGWSALDIDGNNIEQIVDACHQASSTHDQPTAIICNTIPGKGVDFMENDYRWHGKPPNADQAKRALEELRALDGIQASKDVQKL